MRGKQGSWFEQLRSKMGNLFVPTSADDAQPRRLGLALGGGGGKGAAHIGVIQVLEELAIPIDLLVGTSAGGAVAILYAAGIDHEAIAEVFRSTDLRRVAAFDPTRTGLFGQKRREEIITRLLGDRTFADLRFPCAVTATDLITGELVVIDEGPLVPALLATTALPALFPPIILGDRVLVDGGLLNNLPVDVVRARGAERVIAVELNDAVAAFALAPVETDNPLARLMLAPQQFSIANRALSLLINHTTHLHLRNYPPDLLISPRVADIPTLDMSNPEKGRQQGVQAARAAVDTLLDLRAWRLNLPAPDETTRAEARAALQAAEDDTLNDWSEDLERIEEGRGPVDWVDDLAGAAIEATDPPAAPAEAGDSWLKLPFSLPWTPQQPPIENTTEHHNEKRDG